MPVPSSPPPPPPPPPKPSTPLISKNIPSSPLPSITPIPPLATTPDINDTSSTDLPTLQDDNPPKKPPRTTPKLPIRLFRPHHIHEPARSIWFDTRLLLLFRLASTSFLIGHLVLFSLDAQFKYTHYPVWNVLALTISLFLVLMCSLLDVIRDDEHEHQLPVNSSATSDIPDVERQSISQIDPPSDPRLARFLTRITVPLYQSFTTATIFGTIVYWAAIFDATNTPLSYHVLVLSAIAPAIAIFDFFLSMRMRFRLVYIPFYILYNAAYALFLWLHARITDTVVYDFLDSTQSQQDFVAKTAGLSIASVVAAFMMYSISLAINACVMHMWPTGEAANKLDKASDNGTTSGNTSKSSSDDSSEEHETGVLLPNNSELCVVVGNEDDLDLSGSFDLMIDRSSAKIHQAKGSMAGSPSAKWFRTGSGRMVKTRSNNSVGMENGGMGIARSDSQNSTWDAWEQPAPRLEDEYFAMPAVYAEQGVEREIVKLKPMPRNDSDRSGRFSRSVSGVSLTRALSGTSLERSGSGSRPSRAGGASVGLGASASARGNMFKSGSGSSLGRSSWRASQEKGRIR